MNGYKTMLKVDMRRLFTSRMFYIMLGIALCMPIAILVMTSSLAGTETTNPQTGEVTVMEGFENTWDIIGSESDTELFGGTKTDSAAEASDNAAMGMNMDMTSMCNINLVYFMLAVFLCVFVGGDFRSGYAKNLFTVRAKKGGYVASKTVVGLIAGAAMLVAFFIGTVLGGNIAGLSFDLGSAGADGLVMCMLAKIFLMGVFTAISLAMSVYAKKHTWLSIMLSLFGGMLLFMMIPMLTPLNSGFMNVFMCLAGGAIFAAAIGSVSRVVLLKTDLV